MSCYSEKEKKEQKTKQTTTTTKNPKPNKPNKTPNQNNNKKIFLILWKKKKPRTFSNPSGQSSLAHIAVLP